MTILYFTGTGNSLAAAKAIGGELISIPQAVRAGRFEFADNAIGVVFPTYCYAPPRMVRDFVGRAVLRADYRFAVATCGMIPGTASAQLQRLAGSRGWQFDYTAAAVMVDNYLPLFEMGAQIASLPKKRVGAQLEHIAADIAARRRQQRRASPLDLLMTAAGRPLLYRLDRGLEARAFLVDDRCIRCGICARVCPADNITVADRVVFGDRCQNCFACLHACPRGALHLKSERSERRWRNPQTPLGELIRANSGALPDSVR